MFKNINKKIIYFISGVFIIISIINIFLANILFQNTIIELYDPSNDINKASSIISKSLTKQAERRAGLTEKYNANSKSDYETEIKIKEEFNKKIKQIIKNGNIENCYTDFNSGIEIDKCIKTYKNNIILGLSFYNIGLENKQILIKEICNYGQMDSKNIEDCITQNSIKVKPINIFKCKDLYSFDKELLKKCYINSLEKEIYKRDANEYMEGILKFNKNLIKIDNKGRVKVKRMNSEILKEHPEYSNMFSDIHPYFTGLEIKNNKILNNYSLLKEILIEYIYKYNDLKKYNIFKYSKYKDKVNEKIEIN